MTPEEKEDIQDNEEQEAISPIVDKAFIEQSAKEFADSIKSGDLYRELKGEGKGD